MNRISEASGLCLMLWIVLAGCQERGDRFSLPTGPAQEVDAMSLVVETVRAERRLRTAVVRASGSTQPVRAANLSPESQGLISAILVDEGSRVEADLHPYPEQEPYSMH